MREKEIDPRAQDFIREILARAGGNYVTHFSGDDPTLSFELADALRRGEIVALQGDRPRAGGRTVIASLFGRPMPLPIGPAALARAAGVPIVPVFNFREGRFLMRAVVRPPFHVASTADRRPTSPVPCITLPRRSNGPSVSARISGSAFGNCGTSGCPTALGRRGLQRAAGRGVVKGEQPVGNSALLQFEDLDFGQRPFAQEVFHDDTPRIDQPTLVPLDKLNGRGLPSAPEPVGRADGPLRGLADDVVHLREEHALRLRAELEGDEGTAWILFP